MVVLYMMGEDVRLMLHVGAPDPAPLCISPLPHSPPDLSGTAALLCSFISLRRS